MTYQKLHGMVVVVDFECKVTAGRWVLHLYTHLGWVHLLNVHTHLSRSLLQEPWLRANEKCRSGTNSRNSKVLHTGVIYNTAFLCFSLSVSLFCLCVMWSALLLCLVHEEPSSVVSCTIRHCEWTKMAFWWDVTSSALVDRYQGFGETCCLHPGLIPWRWGQWVLLKVW
jgi:hypothetical protein